MDRRERDTSPGLAVEVAKLRLRVAAEKAEPARLLRQQVAAAPLPTLGTALLAGLVLGSRSKAGSATAGAAASAALGSAAGVSALSELVALVTRALSEGRR